MSDLDGRYFDEEISFRQEIISEIHLLLKSGVPLSTWDLVEYSAPDSCGKDPFFWEAVKRVASYDA